MRILSNLTRALKVVALAPVRLMQAPYRAVEKITVDTLQAAIQSFLRKFLRGLVATGLLVLVTVIPSIQDLLTQAGMEGGPIEKAVYGFVVTALAAALAFFQKLRNTPPPPDAK